MHQHFDQILGRHLERLIGSKYGIGALPLNLAVVSCLILIMERENEMESLPPDSSERYTLETLCSELDQIGFNSGWDMNSTAREMIQKNYLNAEHDNRLTPNKPALSMTRLLDLAFPRMPGMNLVAYFIQTMDEVKSERKELKFALEQFDQTLQIHGVSLIQKQPPKDIKKSDPLPAPTQKPHLEKPVPLPEEKRQVFLKEQVRPSGSIYRPGAENRRQDSRDFSSTPRILSSNAVLGALEIKRVDFEKPFAPKTEPEKTCLEHDDAVESFPPLALEKDLAAETATKTEPKEQGPAFDSSVKPEAEISFEAGLETQKNNSSAQTAADSPSTDVSAALIQTPLHTPASEAQEIDMHIPLQQKEFEAFAKPTDSIQNAENIPETTGKSYEKQFFEQDDDIVKKQIASFEEGLALECPICRRAKIQTEQTVKGKLYYKCPDRTCNFISWGKPYHIFCPQCKNPYLIETQKAEKSILKCPRATCRYRQKAPWDRAEAVQDKSGRPYEGFEKSAAVSEKPRKKVVKRRRVRRKK